LVEQRIGDRVGLIAFSQEAFLIAPLTFDIGAVIGLLDELGIGLPGHRTDLGRAVGLTIQTFRKEPPATRVLLVISDGEDNTGALAVDDAVRLAAQHDIRIHTIGFSSDLKPDGAAVLRRMAQATGGAYLVAQSPQALAAIADEIDRIEPSATEQDAVRRDWSRLALLAALTALAPLAWREAREG
jgi:Ca-activated chloride channel family protein